MLVANENLKQESIVIIFGQKECNKIIYNQLFGNVYENQNRYSNEMIKIYNSISYSFFDINIKKEVEFANYQRLIYLINNFTSLKILIILNENDLKDFENFEIILEKYFILFPNFIEYLDSIGLVFANCNFKNDLFYSKSVLEKFYLSCTKPNLKTLFEKLIKNNNFTKINSFEEISYDNLLVKYDDSKFEVNLEKSDEKNKKMDYIEKMIKISNKMKI